MFSMGSTENWSFPCLGDDEELAPSPDELDSMYQRLADGETVELSWKCSGRRQPTPTNVAQTEIKEETNAEA